MSADVTLTAADEGKRVVTEHGDTVGRVVEVRHGRAYVDPDPGASDDVMSALGWGTRDDGRYLLENRAIDAVTDEAIRLASI